MLFRKKIEPSCTYCAHAAQLDDDTILCAKKGIKTDTDTCFRFRYDPCKRIPPKVKAMDFSRYDQEDFKL